MESKLSELISRLKSGTTRVDNRDKDYTIVCANDEVKRVKEKLFHNGQEIIFKTSEESKEFSNALQADVIKPFTTRKS